MKHESRRVAEFYQVVCVFLVCFSVSPLLCKGMGNAQTFQRLVSEELYKQYLNPFFKIIPLYFIIVPSIVDFNF